MVNPPPPPLNISVVFIHPFLPLKPLAHPSCFPFLPVLLILEKAGFCLPWHPLFSSVGEKGKIEDEGLKVCVEKFLEDVSGLCSQGTSCSQCEHGTLSMRSISMTIIFILQQSGSRQHSTTGGRQKKKSFFQFDTLSVTF